MNKIEKKIEWHKFIISLSPIFLIFYISNETYAIDYRAFYLAGKSVLNNLNPYLTQYSKKYDLNRGLDYSGLICQLNRKLYSR